MLTDGGGRVVADQKTEKDLIVDPARRGVEEPTGILVRARHDDRWVNADIAELDETSLTRWLKSRGGDNPWAEQVVRILLGHPNIPPDERGR